MWVSKVVLGTEASPMQEQGTFLMSEPPLSPTFFRKYLRAKNVFFKKYVKILASSLLIHQAFNILITFPLNIMIQYKEHKELMKNIEIK